jgi:hypothetical protein
MFPVQKHVFQGVVHMFQAQKHVFPVQKHKIPFVIVRTANIPPLDFISLNDDLDPDWDIYVMDYIIIPYAHRCLPRIISKQHTKSCLSVCNLV